MSTKLHEETIGHLDFNPEVPCNSMYCEENLHKPAHPADWYVKVTCPECGIWDWCNERFMIYTRDRINGDDTYCSIHGGFIEITWWKPVRMG